MRDLHFAWFLLGLVIVGGCGYVLRESFGLRVPILRSYLAW